MIEITESGGNVFEDLELPDAEDLKLRAQLMIEIEQYIEQHELTQGEAAKRLHTT